MNCRPTTLLSEHDGCISKTPFASVSLCLIFILYKFAVPSQHPLEATLIYSECHVSLFILRPRGTMVASFQTLQGLLSWVATWITILLSCLRININSSYLKLI